MSEDDTNEKKLRELPISDLQYQYLLSENEWGKESVDPILKEKLTIKKYYVVQKKAADGRTWEEVQEEKTSLWEYLSFLTRDVRLGNLNYFDLERVRQRLRLTAGCLAYDMKKSAFLALADSAITLETSQSYSGFLRRRPNTLRTEKVESSPLEPRQKDPYYGKNMN